MSESEIGSKQTDGTDNTTEPTNETVEKTVSEKNSDHEQKINELNDKYLRLYSEFPTIIENEPIKKKLTPLKQPQRMF